MPWTPNCLLIFSLFLFLTELSGPGVWPRHSQSSVEEEGADKGSLSSFQKRNIKSTFRCLISFSLFLPSDKLWASKLRQGPDPAAFPFPGHVFFVPMTPLCSCWGEQMWTRCKERRVAVVLFCCLNKVPQGYWVASAIDIDLFPQFWRLRVQGHGVSRTGPFWGGKQSLFRLSSSFCGSLIIIGIPWIVEAPLWFLSLPSQDILPLCLFYCFFDMITGQMDWGTPLIKPILSDHTYNDPLAG